MAFQNGNKQDPHALFECLLLSLFLHLALRASTRMHIPCKPFFSLFIYYDKKTSSYQLFPPCPVELSQNFFYIKYFVLETSASYSIYGDDQTLQHSVDGKSRVLPDRQR